MSKPKITIATIGHMPAELDKRRIKKWSSKVFSVVGDIENYSLTKDSDGNDWEFTDKVLEDILPSQFAGDFLIAVVNIPLEDNWYTRRLNGNRVAFTFHEIKEILSSTNIPLENNIYRLLYSYTFLYLRSGFSVPINEAKTNFTHDETRGCLFDMNGIKTDIIYSLHKPAICSDCIERLRNEKVANDYIDNAQKEIKRIKKPLFFRILEFIKKHPLWSMLISALTAIILGAIGSFLGSVFYELVKNAL